MEADSMIKRYKYLIAAILFLWVIGVIMSIFLSDEIRLGADTYSWYDSGSYWNRGLNLWKDGGFSLLNIDGYRGYVYPVYLGICSKCLGGVKGFVVINSLILSLWWVFCFPKLHGKEKTNFGLREFVSVIICFWGFNIFFYGLSIYPLTDLFAVLVCSLGVLLAKKMKKEKYWQKCLLLIFFVGCMSYFVYNIRTIYIFSGICLLVGILVYLLKSSWVLWKKILLFVSYIIGVVVAALPQLYMNFISMRELSIKVPTNGLMLQQVYWGILYQRYDTYVGGSGIEHNPQVYFVDPVGSALLSKEGISEFSEWKDFFDLIIKYPCEIIGIYVKHLVNCMLPCWANQYVTDLDNNKILIGSISFICFFFFGIAVYKNFVDKKWIMNYIIILVPCLFILPGAVEVRFMAVVYIMMLGVLCYNVIWYKMLLYIKENKIRLTILFCICGGILLAIWTNMLASESTYSIFMG